ncbi:MAG: hypothetical protein H7Y22_19860, partial [Gemmatimonadaceae bacterium]|nr:hypothetical protein [Gloeobacterales cyanobacterium ES-bin-141]
DPEARKRYLDALHQSAAELHTINAELQAITADFQRQFDESPIGQRQAGQKANVPTTDTQGIKK